MKPVQPWISLAARVVLAVVWLWAGLAKAFHPVNSVAAVRAYELVPETAAQFIGWGLPWLEIALGLIMLAGVVTRPAAAVSAAIFVVFIIGVASAWARGLSIDCGCFGGGGQVHPDHTAYLSEIARDVLFLAFAAWLTWKPCSPFSVDRWLSDPEFIEDRNE